MKYMLLIQLGDSPTPRDPDAWARLSQDEQNAVYAAYGAINEADDLDAAIDLASRIPAASMGGAVEVRPILES